MDAERKNGASGETPFTWAVTNLGEARRLSREARQLHGWRAPRWAVKTMAAIGLYLLAIIAPSRLLAVAVPSNKFVREGAAPH